MKKVYSSQLPFLVGQLKGILEAHHIACVTRNDFLQGAAGELPPTECWPELWILEDFQWQRAMELVAAFDTGAPRAAPWRCDGCGEQLEGQFGSCWQCGRERPDLRAAEP